MERVPSTLLATSASVPCGLIDTPEGPAPVGKLAITFELAPFSETTVRTESGTSVGGEPGCSLRAAVTRASDSPGVTATLVGGPVTLKPGEYAAGLKVQWFDPRTGTLRDAVSNGPGEYRAPDEQDWLLVLRGAGKGKN